MGPLVVWVFPWWVALIGIGLQAYTLVSITRKIHREERYGRTDGV